MRRPTAAFALSLLLAACGGGQSSPGASNAFLSGAEESHFNAALQARRDGNRELARQNLEASLAANPRYLAAHLALADLHYEDRRWHEARESYRSALALRELSTDAHLGVARSSIQLGEFEMALTHALRGAETAGNYATPEIRGECFLLQGEALAGLNRLDEAADALSRSLEIDPGNTMSRIQIARIRARGGDIPEAIRLLSRAEAYETDPVMLRELGRLYFDLRLDTRALETLQKSREASPNDVDTLFLLSATQMRMGNHDVAIQLASDVIAQQPDFLPAYTIRGRGELVRERWDRARQDANYVLERDDRNFAAKLLLGDAALGSGQPDRAEAHLREALTWRPGDIDGLDHLARLLQQQQRWPELIETLEPHVDSPLALSSWRSWLAEAYLSSGRTADGIRMRSRIAMDNTSDGALHRDVARLALDNPGSLDPEQTLRHARIAIERSGGGTVEYRMLIIDALYEAGRNDEADGQLQTAMQAWPNHPEVQRRRDRLRSRR